MFVRESLSTASNEETFLQDFSVILKRPLQNYRKIFKKMFPQYYMDSDVSKRFRSPTTHHSVTRRKRFKYADGIILVYRSNEHTLKFNETGE